jgi:ribonuclease HI
MDRRNKLKGNGNKQVEAYFAGCCEPDPGSHAAWGALIYAEAVEQWLVRAIAVADG